MKVVRAIVVLLLAAGGLWAGTVEIRRAGWGLPAAVNLVDEPLPMSWEVSDRAPSCLADVTARRPNDEWAICRDLCGSLPPGPAQDGPPAGAASLADLVAPGARVTNVPLWSELPDGADMRCARLTNVTFAVGLLDGLDLRCTRLDQVQFVAAGAEAPHLTRVDLSGSSVTRSDFGAATITDANLTCASVDGGTFDKTSFDRTILWAARVTGTALAGAKIEESIASHAVFNSSDPPENWTPLYPREFRTLLPAGVIVAAEDGAISLVGGAPAWESAIAPLAGLAKSLAEGGATQSAAELNHRIEAFWLLWHRPKGTPDSAEEVLDWGVWGFHYLVAMISDNRTSYRRPPVVLWGLWAVASIVFLVWLGFEHRFSGDHRCQLRTVTPGGDERGEGLRVDSLWDAISVAGAFGFKACVLRWVPMIWKASWRPEFVDLAIERIDVYRTRRLAQAMRLAFDAAGVVIFVGLLSLLGGDALGLLGKIFDRKGATRERLSAPPSIGPDMGGNDRIGSTFVAGVGARKRTSEESGPMAASSLSADPP